MELLVRIRTSHPSVTVYKANLSTPAITLADALVTNNVLTQLVLSGLSEYSTVDVCRILEALSNNESLKLLDLSSIDMDPVCLEHVAEYVQYAPALSRLDISFNEVPPEYATQLGQALRGHKTMRVVMAEGADLCDDGLMALLEGIGGPNECKLEKMDLSHNSIGEPGVAALATFLEANTSLTSINLNGNFVPAEYQVRIHSALQRNGANSPSKSRQQTDLGALLAAAGKDDALPSIQLMQSVLARELRAKS